MKFKTAVKFSDFAIAAVCVAIVIALYVRALPTDLRHLSTIVLGLVVVSGILTGFAGFWLAAIYIDAEQAIKKSMKKRVIAAVLIMFVVAAFTIGGVSHLVNGNTESAFRYALIGTFIILLTLIDFLCFNILHGFSERELAESLS